MFNDIYLKFPSQETAQELISGLPYEPEKYVLDVVGVIYKPTGNVVEVAETISVIDEETGEQSEQQGELIEVPEVLPLEGYHANIRLLSAELPEVLQQYAIAKPNNPVRGWA